MMAGDRLHEIGFCYCIRDISLQGECPFRWWLGKSGKFYLRYITNLLPAKDCRSFEMERPAEFATGQVLWKRLTIQGICNDVTVVACDVFAGKCRIPAITTGDLDLSLIHISEP